MHRAEPNNTVRNFKMECPITEGRCEKYQWQL
nr:MAG TPA: hypothetical protein [Caudoviricetes sp.]